MTAQLLIIGNAGADPELRFTKNGKQLCELRVAVNWQDRDANGEQTKTTEWFRVTIWGPQAERAAEVIRRGDRVMAYGRFKTREYDDRDGNRRKSLELTADVCQQISGRSEERAAVDDARLDDLPF